MDAMLDAGFFLGLFSDPEYGGDTFLRNVGWLSTDYMVLYPRSLDSSGPQMLQINTNSKNKYS
jgi:hypothetical protein